MQKLSVLIRNEAKYRGLTLSQVKKLYNIHASVNRNIPGRWPRPETMQKISEFIHYPLSECWKMFKQEHGYNF